MKGEGEFENLKMWKCESVNGERGKLLVPGLLFIVSRAMSTT